MTNLRLVVTGTTLIIVAGCADAPSEPTLPTRNSTASARQVETSGQFVAQVDFSSLTLTPRGNNCRLEVRGQLVFSGAIQGVATGQTSALVFAPCELVATTPPGTFRDVFKSELVFEGTVNGEPAHANLLYMGQVEPGGQIDGRLIFSNGISGELAAQAIVAVGGDYSGTVVVR
jgi:hypothetical protein